MSIARITTLSTCCREIFDTVLSAGSISVAVVVVVVIIAMTVIKI